MVVHALSHNSLRLLLLCLLCGSATGAEESSFTVNVEGLRMREGPSIESGVRKSLAKGTILVQISEEEHAANIDGYRSYWIEVRDDTGSRGWVYRAYLIRIGVYSQDSVTNECVAGDCVNGRGVLVWSDGFTYEGAFRNGVYDGQGVLRLGDRRIYSGRFTAGLYHGRGVLTPLDGSLYDGAFVDGQFSGHGSYQGPDLAYEGEWDAGVPDGYGRLERDAMVLQGNWVAGWLCQQGDCQNGEGQRVHFQGDEYEGHFAAGRYEGEGVLTNRVPGSLRGVQRYEGEFAEGQFSGFGRMEYSDGASYQGEWVDGKRHGMGVYESALGDRQVGLFEDGRFVGARN